MFTTNIQKDDYVIGIDIGGTNFRIGAVTRDLTIVHSERVSSRSLFESADPLLVLSDYIDSYMKKVPSGSCRGICLGFPGTVDKTKKVVYSCPNLPSITNKPVGKTLEERFHVPVYAEHDVILLLANDMKAAHMEGLNTIIALYVGTGLGNALFINGRFLDGKNGVAGELGHIPVMGKTERCPCGNQGCLELYCAGKRLEQIYHEFYEGTDFNDLFTHFEESAALAEFVDSIAIAAATEINILDPDRVLLSGGVLNMKEFPYEHLLERIHFYSRKPYPDENLEFVRGVVDPFSGVLGAAIYLWDKF